MEPIVASVRARPGMYIGATDEQGLHHLVWLCLDACVDGSHPKNLELRVDREGGLIIRAAIDRFDATLRGLLEKGRLRAPGSPADELVIASALSRRFFIAWAGEEPWSWAGREGAPASDVVPPEPAEGLTIALAPDPAIFQQPLFNRAHLKHRLRELAALYPPCRCTFFEELTGALETVCLPHGLEAFVDEICGVRGTLDRPFSAETMLGEVRVRVAVQSLKGQREPQVVSWANTVRTHGGGTHVTGLLTAFQRAVGPINGLPVGAIAVEAPRTMLNYRGPTKNVLAVEGLELKIANWLEPLLREAFDRG
ncbi:MAG: hypothetical protein QM723_15185 [Myxococcaceae bacterium]